MRALFQRRVSGDDTLLRLAELRFRQAGLAAEVYAGSPSELEHVLGLVPSHRDAPVVHLDRNVNVLDGHSRERVAEFARRFAGRVWGLVFHDKTAMASRGDELVVALRELDGIGRGGAATPYLFLEYAAGVEPERFVELAERVRDTEHVSMCIDVGHVGIRQARRHFARVHPDLDLAALTPRDPRLPELVDDVRDAVATALPTVLELTRSLRRIGKPVHFHLHDGHPLIPGLSDHFSFLTEVAIPFCDHGRWSLPSLYGPTGLAHIVDEATYPNGGGLSSLTLEIHQAEGRLPLGDAEELFAHWSDRANAERMNYWLAVLVQNSLLIRGATESATC